MFYPPPLAELGQHGSHGSALGGRQVTKGRCPFCLWPINDDEALLTCAHCSINYHEECYAANGACTTFGCPGWAQRPLGGAGVDDAPNAANAAPRGAISVSLDDWDDDTLEPPVVSEPVTQTPLVAFCDQCGAPVTLDDRFCGGCGHSIGGVT